MGEPSSEATVGLEASDQAHVSIVRIDRPAKRNALDGATRTALLERMREAIDEGTRAIVLTGSGKTFASGADLQEMAARSVEEQRAYLAVPRMYEAIESLDAPVIAAINGHALGAGLELALACDVRMAAAGAKLGSPEVRLGIIPGGGGTQRLPRLIGLGNAMRLVLTGEAVDADQAHALGLVEQVVDPDELEQSAVELAGQMARWSPVALAAAKRALRASWSRHLAEGLREEVDRFADVFGSADAKEGISAFLEKREPQFGDAPSEP